MLDIAETNGYNKSRKDNNDMREGARQRGRLTVLEAAARLAITPEAVRVAIRGGKLSATLQYRQYWISEKSVSEYPATRQAEAGRRSRRRK